MIQKGSRVIADKKHEGTVTRIAGKWVTVQLKEGAIIALDLCRLTLVSEAVDAKTTKL